MDPSTDQPKWGQIRASQPAEVGPDQSVKPRIRTTEGDDRLDRPADLVERQFRAPAPNRLWVADLTYVKTHSGWVYVAFIIDVFSRMIVGWQASRSLRSDLAIDALEMAVFNRRRAGGDLSQLTHHSDRGVVNGQDRVLACGHRKSSLVAMKSPRGYALVGPPVRWRRR